ncbi:hypothetical protein [Streptomyces sp. UG1]|uniref:hypothetical protein n=1 Tax=Streptomyces sp. UG1 TaxID=3417652 RepID=UPI003CE7C8CF
MSGYLPAPRGVRAVTAVSMRSCPPETWAITPLTPPSRLSYSSSLVTATVAVTPAPRSAVRASVAACRASAAFAVITATWPSWLGPSEPSVLTEKNPATNPASTRPLTVRQAPRGSSLRRRAASSVAGRLARRPTIRPSRSTTQGPSSRNAP